MRSNFRTFRQKKVRKFCEIFENFQNISLENFEKSIILAYFSTNFNKPCVNFSRVWRKNTNSWETLRNFRKIISLEYFSKNFTSHPLIFRSFGRKLHNVRKF